MTKEYCDRCGEEIKIPRAKLKKFAVSVTVKIKYLWWCVNVWHKNLDCETLCIPCYKKFDKLFEEFMEGKNAEPK